MGETSGGRLCNLSLVISHFNVCPGTHSQRHDLIGDEEEEQMEIRYNVEEGPGAALGQVHGEAVKVLWTQDTTHYEGGQEGLASSML